MGVKQGMAVCVAALLSACRSTPPPVAVDSGYVTASACQPCHNAIWETYKRTGMGRSFARVTAQTASPAQYSHPASQRQYMVAARDGRFFQRRTQRDAAGAESNAIEKEMHYVVGSGNHSRTYLHRRPDGRLAELPLSWYSEKGGIWAMSPGYDRPDHEDFRRDISFQCLFCHNAYPTVAAAADRSGAAPLFPAVLPEGIDCQRCHGPGRRHVETKSAADVVNPARLSPERQLDLCMQCHLETTSFRLPGALLRYERNVFSYRPGEPLGDYALYFDHPPAAGRDDKFEIAHQAYRMRQSACFQKSGGSLVCTSCHNPHEAPRADGAACLRCHAQATGHGPATRCVECHMPKRRTEDVVHVVMTDHRIQRRPPARDLTAPLAERGETDATAYKGEVALYYPASVGDSADQELYLAVAQVRQGANLTPGLARLRDAIEKCKPARGEFAFELADGLRKSGSPVEAIGWFERALAADAGFVPALRGLAAALGAAGRLRESAEHLRKALAISPRDAAVANDLGLVLIGLGERSEALAVLRKAVEIDPDFSEAQNNIAGVLLGQGDVYGAERAYRAAITVAPDFSEAHRNLANLLAARPGFTEADFHYREAIRAKPGYAAASLDYSAFLAGQEKLGAARQVLEAALKIQPALAGVHNALGEILTMQGEANKAIAAFRRAVELQPDLATAQANLGTALVFVGRSGEARRHLEKAVLLDPSCQECYLHLGRILASDGNQTGAAAAYRKAAESRDEGIRKQAVEGISRIGSVSETDLIHKK